jgi:parallel beta-helix repeat protein
MGLVLLFLLSSVIPISMGFEGWSPDIIKQSSNRGNTIYVGGTGLNNYTKIQDAIDNASEGDTVYVYDDSSPYEEGIRIDKSLQLIGEDKTTTIVNSHNQMTIRCFDCNNILIKGFTLLNNYQNYYAYGVDLSFAKNITLTETIIIGCHWGVQLSDSSNCSITNNEIKDGFIGINVYRVSSSIISKNQLTDNNYGIKLNGAGYTDISDNTFTNNGLHLVHSEPGCSILRNTVNNKELLYLENDHDLTLDNISIGQLFIIDCENITVKNIEISNASIGIEIIGSDNCLITKSKIHSNFDAGVIFVERCNNNTISHCEISNNSHGIVIRSVHYTFFGSNDIIGNTLRFNDKGIYLLGLKNTIKDNIITYNNEGIELRGLQNVLTNNQIANSHGIGLYLFYASSCLIRSNNFINNQKHAGFEMFSRRGNQFLTNYWDTSGGFGPKAIFGMRHIQFFVDYWGNPLYFSFPWVQLDWHPAKEPYDI